MTPTRGPRYGAIVYVTREMREDVPDLEPWFRGQIDLFARDDNRRSIGAIDVKWLGFSTEYQAFAVRLESDTEPSA